MEKNWLIRTQNKKILGPVSKSKIIELVQKKSLTENDEICPGNGHWFFIREKELADQFLWGDLPSSFNPVSEAPCLFMGRDFSFIESFLLQIEKGKMRPSTVGPKAASDSTSVLNLAQYHESKEISKETNKETKEIKENIPFPPFKQIDNTQGDDAAVADVLPSEEDLEYPSLEGLADTGQPVMVTTSEAKSHPYKFAEPVIDEMEIKLPEKDDLEYPSLEIESAPAAPVAPVVQTIEPLAEPPPSVIAKPSIKKMPTSSAVTPSPSSTSMNKPKAIDPMVLLRLSKKPERPMPAYKKRNDLFLIVLFFMIVIVIVYLFYHYTQTVQKTI